MSPIRIVTLLCLAALWSAGRPALAEVGFSFGCTVVFVSAGLTEDAVKETYVALLDRVGKAEVTPELLEAIHRSGDPFSLPGDTRLTSSLDKFLADFKLMLESHSGTHGMEVWNRVLLSAISDRLAGKTVAGEAVETAVAKSAQVTQVIEDERMESLTPSLVGNWLVVMKSEFQGKGKEQREVLQVAYRGLDGRTANATVISPIPLNSSTEEAATHFLPNGDFYVAPVKGKPKLLRGSLYDGNGNPLPEITLNPVTTANVPANARIYDLTTSPDGRNLLFRTSNAVWVSELPADATAPLAARKLGPFSYMSIRSKPAFFQFVGNDRAAFSHEGAIQVVPLGEGKPYVIPFQDDVSSLLPTPDGKQLFVYTYGADAQKRTLSAVDLATGNKVARSQVKLPTFTSKNRQTPPKTFTFFPYQMMLTPDAKHFVAVLNGGFHRSERELVLIDAKTKEIVKRRKYDSPIPIESWAFSTDGERLVGHRSDSVNADAFFVWNLKALAEAP